MTRRPQIKPPPGPPCPPAPPFGWVGSVDHLTVGELEDITQVTQDRGTGLEYGALAAIAYARRLDPDLYQWEHAGRLPFHDLATGTVDQAADVPAPPGPPCPPAPACGWVGSSKQLTVNEAVLIDAHVPEGASRFLRSAYGAIAVARRYDSDLYQWGHARQIPFADLRDDVLDGQDEDDQDEEEPDPLAVAPERSPTSRTGTTSAPRTSARARSKKSPR